MPGGILALELDIEPRERVSPIRLFFQRGLLVFQDIHDLGAHGLLRPDEVAVDRSDVLRVALASGSLTIVS